MKTPLPDNEAARLKALWECKLLDTAPEKAFDDITQLAASICGTPIALVSLVDANRQWFKSKVGYEATETPRDVAFCTHAILQPDVLIVPDTLDDKRFATNPLVTSYPHIRFYAGVTLITSENHALGTLCVIDHVPRELKPQQLEALRTLGCQVVKEIELRRSVVKLERTAPKLQQSERWRRQFFKRIAAGLGLASAILVSVGLVSSRNLSSLVKKADWQIQHYKVLEDLKDVHSHIQKATIAKHRYIITGESSYLEPYYDAAKEISQEITALRQATANNSDQQRRLATLEHLISRKFAEIEETNNLRKTKGFETTSQALLIQKAKKLTDDIEATIREMEKAENVLVTRAAQEEKASTRNIIFTFFGGILLNFLILAVVYYFIYREITSRKQTEVALKQERDFTAAVINTVSALVVVLDSQGRIIRFNRACEQTTGYSFAEVKDKYFWDLFLIPQEVEPVKAVFKELRAGQFPNQYENYWVTRNGDRRLIAWSNTTLLDKDGVVEYVIGTGIDITERQRAESGLRESEERYRDLFENANDLIQSVALDGRIVYVNRAWREALGYSEAEIADLSIDNIIHPDCQAHYMEVFWGVISGEKIDEFEAAFITKDGKKIWVEGSINCKFVDGQPIATRGILRDITERKQTAAALEQANEKLTSWVNELEQHNREIALLGEMSDVLQACLTVEEAYSAIAHLVQPLFPQTNGGIFLISASKNLVETVATWGSPPFTSQKLFTPHDCWALRRGQVHWVEDTDNGLLCKHVHYALPAESLCVPMMAQGEALGVLHLNSPELGRLTEAKQQLAVTVAEHIALALANLKLRETLQNQSIRDSLTGLFNRRYMEESLKREMYRCDRKQQPLSIIMLDIDHFKHFNDTFGHEAGDAVLRELGLFLQKHIRGSDIACRYGGEEFTLILPEASLEVVQRRVEQLRQGAKHLNVLHRSQQLDAITLSLGVACFPEHGLTGEAVLQAADAALYRAKAQGRDRVVTAL